MLLAVALIVIIGIQMTSYIVTILVVALILAMLMYPAMKCLQSRGMPDIAAVGIITTVACTGILAMFLMVLYSFEVLVNDLPLYQEALSMRLSDLIGLLQQYGIDTGSFSPSSVSLGWVAGAVSPYAIGLGNLVLYLFFIAITTFFMLLEAPRFPERMRKIAAGKTDRIERFSRMSRFMIEFVIVRTETNFVHGCLFGGFLWLMGVHAAGLWAIMTFLLGYIPYLGLIAAAIPAVFFAWIQFGLWGAVAVLVAVAILNALVENPIFAHFASRRFEIPALVVVLSVIFWGWALGLAGMIFAVPLTLLVLIFLQNSDDMSWVNTLLGVDHLFDEDIKPGPEGGDANAPPSYR